MQIFRKMSISTYLTRLSTGIPTLGIKHHSKLLTLSILPLLSSPLEKVFNQGFIGGKAQPLKLSLHLTGGLHKGMFSPRPHGSHPQPNGKEHEERQ